MPQHLELTADDICSMLQAIPAHDREDWVTIGMVLKSYLGDNGFALFDDWSQTAANYKASAARSVWRSFRGSGVGIGSLVHLAKQNGWNRNAPATPAPAPRRAPTPQQSDTARYAAELWLAADCSDTSVTAHPYAQAKRLLSAGGAGRGIARGSIIGKLADCIIVPIRENGDGKVQGVQSINSDGAKQTFGSVSGGYLLLGNTLDKSQIWYVLEGWASAYALVFHHLNGNGCAAVSFGKSNQRRVAELIASHHEPDRTRILLERDQ
jgi:putative DNA primase/helicase